jgi:vancomycin resistance protein YoaR
MVIAAAALLLLGFDLAVSAGHIHRGVSVGGIPVGGMTQAEATAALKTALPRLAAKPVTLSADGLSRPVTTKEIGLTFDYKALVAAAYAHGRDRGPLTDLADRLSGWWGNADVPVVPVADPAKVKVVLDSASSKLESEPRDAGVVIDGTQASLRPAQAGVKVQRVKTTDALMRAFVSGDRTANVVLSADQPRVGDQAAERALADARRMLSAPVKIVFEGKSWEFSPAQIASWIAFRATLEASRTTGSAATSSVSATPSTGRESASGGLEAFVDPKTLSGAVAKLGAVGRLAKDASFRVSNGAVSIVPSQDGVGPNTAGLALELTQVLKDPERVRSVALRTHRVAASITTAKARTMGIKERLSRYTTTYAASNKPRVNNIHLLADALDGTLVAPGATFSFNDTIGPRTAAKGYQEAPAIVNGKLEPQLGGGICQVGTTIFNTVFESGLPVVRRSNHSFYISHYPTGRDATVSWGGPDFKFKNDTDNWVLVVAGYSDSSLTIALYGTDPGYEVRSSAGEWQNEKPFSTETIKDPTLPAGARVVEDSGITGRSITVTRIVTKDGQEVRKDSFRSVYKPKTEVVRLGTKPVKPSKPATQTAAP